MVSSSEVPAYRLLGAQKCRPVRVRTGSICALIFLTDFKWTFLQTTWLWVKLRVRSARSYHRREQLLTMTLLQQHAPMTTRHTHGGRWTSDKSTISTASPSPVPITPHTVCIVHLVPFINPLMHKAAKAWAPDRPYVKIKNHGLGQYGAEPHYSTLPFWQLCALKG